MSIIKTLEQLGQNPGISTETLSVQQQEEIQRLKDSALFINAQMNISDPDEPDDSPDPDRNPDR